jgi:16S rRNA (adenine1518-N6/adenine1519-N6)-dimethyltransferase
VPLSPSATRDLLASLGHQPKRFLGQNFLVDGNIVRKSLELAGVTAGDTVVEVGPGLGTLTTALLEAGADVWAVEKDRNLHAHLEATLGNPTVRPEFAARFHLLEGDAVEHPLAALHSMWAGCPHPASPTFKVVANLPYAIATPWLDEVLSGPLPARMVLMLQQEAAQRYAASPGTKSFGAISVFLQAAYEVAPGHKVGPGCFHPRPDVDSYLINLVRRPAPFVFPKAVKATIRACFQQRRKQIGALLRTHAPDRASIARELLLADGLSEQTRPEAIPVAWWMRFAALPALA